jgi:hypothetical protein
MNADEKAIIEYLRGWPYSFISGKEIARKAGGKRRTEKEPGWAIPVLARMVRTGVLETDHLGHFRLNKEMERKKRESKHVSPQMLRILKSSGKSFEGIVIDEDEEEPPKDNLPAKPRPPGSDKQ